MRCQWFILTSYISSLFWFSGFVYFWQEVTLVILNILFLLMSLYSYDASKIILRIKFLFSVPFTVTFTLLLLILFIQIFNYSSEFQESFGYFTYFRHAATWLPTTYNKTATLNCLFWAILFYLNYLILLLNYFADPQIFKLIIKKSIIINSSVVVLWQLFTTLSNYFSINNFFYQFLASINTGCFTYVYKNNGIFTLFTLSLCVLYDRGYRKPNLVRNYAIVIILLLMSGLCRSRLGILSALLLGLQLNFYNIYKFHQIIKTRKLFILGLLILFTAFINSSGFGLLKPWPYKRIDKLLNYEKIVLDYRFEKFSNPKTRSLILGLSESELSRFSNVSLNVVLEPTGYLTFNYANKKRIQITEIARMNVNGYKMLDLSIEIQPKSTEGSILITNNNGVIINSTGLELENIHNLFLPESITDGITEIGKNRKLAIKYINKNVFTKQTYNPGSFLNKLLDSTSKRDVIYNNSLRMATDHLVFGVGIGSWSSVYSLYKGNDEIWQAWCHSDILEILIEIGLLGLCAFVFIFWIELKWIQKIVIFRIKFLLYLSPLLPFFLFDFPLQVIGCKLSLLVAIIYLGFEKKQFVLLPK